MGSPAFNRTSVTFRWWGKEPCLSGENFYTREIGLFSERAPFSPFCPSSLIKIHGGRRLSPPLWLLGDQKMPRQRRGEGSHLSVGLLKNRRDPQDLHT
jgi:hypothetical protein